MDKIKIKYVKILEIHPEWKRIHKMPNLLYFGLSKALEYGYRFGLKKSLSDLIKELPPEIKIYIKSEKRNYQIQKLKGQEFKGIIVDEKAKYSPVIEFKSSPFGKNWFYKYFSNETRKK